MLLQVSHIVQSWVLILTCNVIMYLKMSIANTETKLMPNGYVLEGKTFKKSPCYNGICQPV